MPAQQWSSRRLGAGGHAVSKVDRPQAPPTFARSHHFFEQSAESMTLRRRFLVVILAAASGAGAVAQVSPGVPTSNPVSDNLNLRFANGIVAVAEEKIITVADVMQYI